MYVCIYIYVCIGFRVHIELRVGMLNIYLATWDYRAQAMLVQEYGLLSTWTLRDKKSEPLDECKRKPLTHRKSPERKELQRLFT